MKKIEILKKNKQNYWKIKKKILKKGKTKNIEKMKKNGNNEKKKNCHEKKKNYFNHFTVEITKFNLSCVLIISSRTSHLWNSPQVSCFPVN